MASIARSIKLSIQVLLVVLALLIISIWSLAARVAAVLQADLENVVSAHLSATVGYVAADIDAKLQLRIGLLSEIAASITPDILADPAKLQRLLDQRRASQALFPNGVFVADMKGIDIAEYPPVPERLGGSIGDRDYFREVTAGAKQAIGRPVLGRFSKRVLVAIAVPLHDTSGGVAGVLVGPVFPSDPNLFGLLEQTTIGNTSYVTVISPKDGVVVSASDQSKILQPMPAKGVNPLFDRRLKGFEGVGRTINASGVDVLTASRHMKTTGWIVLSAIPAEEAFAPIASIKRQIYLAALALSLLAMAVLYFVLQRQLAPLQEAATAMRRMTEGTAAFGPLPGGGKDEIGLLLTEFNRLAIERNRLDESLRRSSILLDSLPLAVRHADKAERITYANRAYRALRDSKAPEPVGRTLREVLDEQRYASMAPNIRRALAGEEIEVTREFVREDGSTGARSTRYLPDRDAAGEVIGFFALVEDISERKRAEAARRESEERLRLVVESLAEGIVVQDAQGRIVSANEAAQRILGLSADELIGRTSIDPRWHAIHEDGSDCPGELHPATQTLRTGEPQTGVIMGVHKPDSALTWLSINSRLLPDLGASRTRGVVTSFTDVTGHKNAEAALQRLNAELEQRVVERTQALEQANREMQSFSYSISHDLRAPLRAINGFSKIVLAENAGKFDPETVDHLGRIAAGAERMGRLIDDLLNLSQVSRTELRRQAVNLSQLAGEVAKNLAQVHPERQVEVLIAPDMMVDADQGLIQIALENLIGNAWKFTSRTDGAKIDVGQYVRDGEMVCFVRDNGAGFDMRYADKLFGAFQRLHTQREFEGTGIGLSIVQRIVIKHGGRIWAEAKPGAGATFHFTLAQGTRAV